MQPNDVGIVAKVVADAIQKATAPLHTEIALLKARQPERGEKGDRGDSGDVGPRGDTGASGEDGRDGIDADPVDLPELAKAAAALIPIPKDGQNGQDGAAGRDGINGKDADPITSELIMEALSASPDLLQKAVDLHLKANPPAAGKDGSDGLNGKDGASGIDGTEGPEGKPGRDGQPGVPGRDGDRGKDGSDGIDGMGFDDIHVAHDGERSFSFKFMRGNREKTFGAFVIPSIIYRSVYKEGQIYLKGDAVTFGGSLWIAQKDTKTKPGIHEDWRLAVKRGTDGKDAK